MSPVRFCYSICSLPVILLLTGKNRLNYTAPNRSYL